jgi:DNA-binding NarL/FixJ family response regulator
VTSESKKLLIVGAKAKRHWGQLEGYFAKNSRHVSVKATGDGAECLLDEYRDLDDFVVIVDFDSITKVDPTLFARRVERGKRLQVLVLIEKQTIGDCESLLRIGCMGFLTTRAPAWQFHRAVDAVSGGEIWAPRKFMSQLCRELLSADDPLKLTAREEEVLALLAAGNSNREIANSLFITRDTVRWHMRSIYRKLGVHDRSSVFAIAAVQPVQKRVLRKKNTEL